MWGGGGHTGASQEPYSLISTQRGCLLQSGGNGLDCELFKELCLEQVKKPRLFEPFRGIHF